MDNRLYLCKKISKIACLKVCPDDKAEVVLVIICKCSCGN